MSCKIQVNIGHMYQKKERHLTTPNSVYLWRFESPGVTGRLVDRLIPSAAWAACSGVSVGGRAREEGAPGAQVRLGATAGAWERRTDLQS